MPDSKELTPQAIDSARRRFAFVAVLWWIAAIAGTLGVLQGLTAGWVRMIFVGISWVLALFFSYAWWEVRKGRLSQ